MMPNGVAQVDPENRFRDPPEQCETKAPGETHAGNDVGKMLRIIVTTSIPKSGVRTGSKLGQTQEVAQKPR